MQLFEWASIIVERKYRGPWLIGRRLGTSLLENPEFSSSGAESETGDSGNRGVVWCTRGRSNSPDWNPYITLPLCVGVWGEETGQREHVVVHWEAGDGGTVITGLGNFQTSKLLVPEPVAIPCPVKVWLEMGLALQWPYTPVVPLFYGGRWPEWWPCIGTSRSTKTEYWLLGGVFSFLWTWCRPLCPKG